MRERPGIGAVIKRFGVCGSTNDVARDLAEAGAAHGTAIVAEEQTKGRGTKGRTWHSPSGKGLYVSFVLRPAETGLGPRSLPLLPLAAGLAGIDAVRRAAGVAVGLKWPNDLVHGKLKLGGILSESVFRGADAVFSIVGIGINVGHRPEDFPEDLRPFATSLELITGRIVRKELLLSRLCRSLESWYNTLRRRRPGAVLRAYEKNMAFSRGDRIIVTAHKDVIAGIFRGLNPDGRLCIEQRGVTAVVPFEDIRALDWG